MFYFTLLSHQRTYCMLKRCLTCTHHRRRSLSYRPLRSTKGNAIITNQQILTQTKLVAVDIDVVGEKVHEQNASMRKLQIQNRTPLHPFLSIVYTPLFYLMHNQQPIFAHNGADRTFRRYVGGKYELGT
jgi:hypothetical protein